MLYLLSPAKKLDYGSPIDPAVLALATRPVFTARAAELIAQLKTLAPPAVAALMSLSDELAALNVARYGAWSARATDRNSRPAALAFNGDVYAGLGARTLRSADLVWAQDHLLILSGLYGVLRPLDRLQPYRLEMGTRLANARGPDLYAYWGATLAQYLNGRLAADKVPLVVNLASHEYARAVPRAALHARVVDCVFEDWSRGRYRTVGVHAKRARGLMARWVVQARVASVERLAHFDAEGYAFDRAESVPVRLVFRRRAA